ncbi:YcdB/YcdC domain-containing protein [Bacillus sp. F56]|uniref:YcdB/YcdC domain-containing protein n=1 Tax=Bacillus sp. F56 TaxID=1581850 RepID=UPI000852CA26|nr:YcdB/YcdC domain-containing protein [Bacillus sp. F56]
MKGAVFVKKEELKQKALEIGRVPTHLKLEIEDFDDDDKRAHFCWTDPQDENIGIIVELGPGGELESLSRDMEPESGERLSEEKLEDIMRQFVETHHPGALSAFVREENDRTSCDKVRFSYVQMEAGLPLPMSGFMADVSSSGEIVSFRYYGKAGSIIKPKRIADDKEVLAFFEKDVEFDLLFEVLHRSVYENGDDQPHLVYEPECRAITVPADLVLEEQAVDDDDDYREPESFPLPLFEEIHEKADPDSMIGIEKGFVKEREVDLNDGRIGIVWRNPNEPMYQPADKSLDSWFKGRTHQVLKTIYHKETGKLEGVMSFMEKKGPLTVTEAECEKIALRFLFALFPNADQYFRIRYDEKDEEENAVAGFTFEAHCHGVPLRFGQIRICVSRQTGDITVYMGPDIDPNELAAIDPVPAISVEQAKILFWQHFKVELGWEREYGDDEEHSYRLVYQPMYPRFIEAHTGEPVFSSW